MLCWSLLYLVGANPVDVGFAGDQVLSDSSSLTASSDLDLPDIGSSNVSDDSELADCIVSSPTAGALHPRQLCSMAQPRRKKRPWKVLRSLPKATNYRYVPTESTDPNEKCGNSKKTLYLGCSGPEVWYDGVLGLVLNCVYGMKSISPCKQASPEK